MIKNTWWAGINAAAGTRLALTLIRSVINSVINYPPTIADRKITHKIRNNLREEIAVTPPEGFPPMIE